MTFDMYNVKSESQIPFNYLIICIGFDAEGFSNEIPAETQPNTTCIWFLVMKNTDMNRMSRRTLPIGTFAMTKENEGYKVSIGKVYIGDNSVQDKKCFFYNGSFK